MFIIIYNDIKVTVTYIYVLIDVIIYIIFFDIKYLFTFNVLKLNQFDNSTAVLVIILLMSLMLPLLQVIVILSAFMIS